MTFDGVTSHQAAIRSAAHKNTFREYMQEAIAIGVIVAMVAQMVVLADVRGSLASHKKAIDLSTSVIHANALVTENALARLENREPSKAAQGFRVPARHLSEQIQEARQFHGQMGTEE